jgi:hypothetical protein
MSRVAATPRPRQPLPRSQMTPLRLKCYASSSTVMPPSGPLTHAMPPLVPPSLLTARATVVCLACCALPSSPPLAMAAVAILTTKTRVMMIRQTATVKMAAMTQAVARLTTTLHAARLLALLRGKSAPARRAPASIDLHGSAYMESPAGMDDLTDYALAGQSTAVKGCQATRRDWTPELYMRSTGRPRLDYGPLAGRPCGRRPSSRICVA